MAGTLSERDHYTGMSAMPTLAVNRCIFSVGAQSGKRGPGTGGSGNGTDAGGRLGFGGLLQFCTGQGRSAAARADWPLRRHYFAHHRPNLRANAPRHYSGNRGGRQAERPAGANLRV